MKQIVLTLLLISISSQSSAQSNGDEWISLFNGRDLSNWIPKFTGYDLGINHLNTFRVEDGNLIVSYDDWTEFNGEFGHLFYDELFSHYLLKVEYRFVDPQVTKGASWAYRNNGLMLHSQSPQSMTLNQAFPASIEVQLLGGNGRDDRPTANVCSPGTHYERDGKLVTQHCVNSSSKTYHGDQWVTVEVEVHGNELVRHTVNGDVVFEYTKIQLDEGDADAQNLIAQGQPISVNKGYISLQAESHPTQFRKIELLPLTP